MKKIICESTYFYGSTQQNPNTFRLMLRFCNPIEETVLRRALALTVQRYPYYMVRCISDGREYRLEPNEYPFELYHTSEPLVMGSEAVNYYLWAANQGAAPQKSAEASGTKEVSSPQPLNLFEDSRLHITTPVSHKLRIRQKDLMQYCREQDGTPGVVTSLLLARAIDAVNPGNTQPIVTGMAINLRPALEAPDYMGSPIGIAYLSYDEKLKEKPFTTQATGYRGRLILASDLDRLRLVLQKSSGLYAMVDSLPQVTTKKAAIDKVLKSTLGMASFTVSYMGPAKLGSVEQYVKEIRLLAAVGENAILIEIMSANGYFYLDFIQQWQEKIYFDAFCQQLSLQGIPYELDGVEVHRVPGIELV